MMEVSTGLRCTVLLLALTGAIAAAEDLFNIFTRGASKPSNAAISNRGDGINVRDARGATPLMYAAAVAPERVVAVLLAVEGIDVNAANQNGTTALMLAIRDPGKVRLLIDKGANVNVVNQGE